MQIALKQKQTFCYVHDTKLLCNNTIHKQCTHIYIYASDVYIFTTYELLNSAVTDLICKDFREKHQLSSLTNLLPVTVDPIREQQKYLTGGTEGIKWFKVRWSY